MEDKTQRKTQMGKKLSTSKMSTICGLAPDAILQGKRYKYVNNNSPILGVAHLDTVQKPTTNIRLGSPPKLHKNDNPKGQALFNPVWDDRLGVYTLVHHLPTYHGITIDWLFTTDEEIGRTTASDFLDDYEAGKVADGKKWNWIVEFDRMGMDVAGYSFLDAEFRKLLEGYFPSVVRGTFTDITEMDTLGVKAFNVGVGYHNPHSADAYMIVDEYMRMVDYFVKFYQEQKDNILSHTVQEYPALSKYDSWKDDYTWGRYKNYDTGSVYTWKGTTYKAKTALTECSICMSTFARYIGTTLEGIKLYMCLDCLQDAQSLFDKKDGV